MAPNSVDPPPQSSQAVCMWPAALCFSYGLEQPKSFDGKVPVSGPECHLSLTGSSEDANGLEWFQTATHPGFQDPLKFAQDWFQSKAKRDEELEARRKERKAKEQEEPPRLHAESAADGGDDPPSPLHLRNGELQAMNGVYPTPPDGMPSQGHAGQPTSDGTITGGDSAESPRRFVGAGSDNTLQLDSARQPDFHPNAGPDLDSPTNDMNSGHDNDDDLFGDMDDEMFNGPAVTDADFSFFDDETMDSTGFDGGMHGEDSTTNEETATKALVPAVKNIASPTDAQWTGSHTAGVSPEQAATSPLVDRSTSVDVGTASAVGQPKSKSPALTKTGEHATISNLYQESDSSPPLSPLLIKQKLLPVAESIISTRSPQCEKRNTTSGLSSEFRPVAFNPQLDLSDAKYESGGRFGVNTLNDVVEQPADTITEGKSVSTTTDKPHVDNISLPPKVRRPRPLPLELSRTSKNYEKHEGTDSDADTDSSMWSEEDSFDDDTSDGPIGTFPEAFLARKRKRDLHDDGMHSITGSFEEMMSSESDTEDDGDEGLVSQDGLSRLITCFEPDRADWSLIGIPPPSCPLTQVLVANRSPQHEASASAPVSLATTPHTATDVGLEGNAFDLGSQDIINIAQILADQSISSTLSLDPGDVELDPLEPRPDVNLALRAVVRKLFSSASQCSLPDLAAIRDVLYEVPSSLKAPPRTMIRRQLTGSTDNTDQTNATNDSNAIFAIPHVYVRVQRAETSWELLPSALAFWEPLGLAPVSGAKDVAAYAIYPFSLEIESLIDQFLDNMRNVYESCKLGSHTRGPELPDGIYEGMAPVEAGDEVNFQTAVEAIRETCVHVGSSLATITAEEMQGTVVIYLVNPFTTASALYHLCASFWALFQAYVSIPSKAPRPDLVLQLVPIRFIASFSAPVIPEPSTLAAFAREVYDRCPPSAPHESKSGALSIPAASFVELAQPLPKRIDFALIPTPPSDLMHDPSFIHLAYAVSIDDTWLTAAWISNSGKYQTTASYCLHNRRFVEVLWEMWQTTIEIIRPRRVSWRLYVARAGIMPEVEQEAWTKLQLSRSPVQLQVVLLAVDVSPPFASTAAITPPPALSGAPVAGFLTPVSTPQALTVSPDAGGIGGGGNAPMTPATLAASASGGAMDEPDSDAHLVDLTDETWGVILAHKLHNTHSLGVWAPGLISGLIVRRDGHNAQGKVPAISVNVLWISAAAGGRVAIGRRAEEALLRELMIMYRGLGLLARVKGVTVGDGEACVPWHVAAALRGARALEGFGVGSV
ncbi:hypothetical protein B0A49_09252 [Cryomyces minteri]|uniref:Mediator of RNA polymerase II transcription subunit 13 n=1 Tax=Cryomyces minteri TaxID=331657 RepID=A0A4U0WXU1_9PEZI|nr:hypothetical protein B0A49_09252 [Cryomyces minteri]